MSSNPPPFLRRARKFPSASGIEAVGTTHNAAATYARPPTRLRSRATASPCPVTSSISARVPCRRETLELRPHTATATASLPQQHHVTPIKLQQQTQLSQQQPTTIEGLINKPPASLTESLQGLRHLIITQGVAADGDGNSALRIYIWSILLGVAPMRTNEYVVLVRREASSSYSKIRYDTFRMLATDPLFRRRVSESSIIRLLNAFQWKMKDTGVDAQDAQYVQGMNAIAAPFLYAAT